MPFTVGVAINKGFGGAEESKQEENGASSVMNLTGKFPSSKADAIVAQNASRLVDRTTMYMNVSLGPHACMENALVKVYVYIYQSRLAY